MDDPNKKARDADRDAAIVVVEAAYADGQITRADSDLRVERLRQAATVGDVQMMVRDLSVSEEGPGVSRLAALAPRPPGGSVRGLKIGVGVIVALVVVLAAAGLVVPLLMLSSVNRDTATSESVEVGPRQLDRDVELTTAKGYDRLVSAVEEKTGSTTVFTATIYAGYALIEVPVDAQSQRSFGYHYDGRLQELTERGTSDQERLELDRIDGTTVATLMKRVNRLVQDPTSSYLLVNAPGQEAGVCLSAYALNEGKDTAYLDARCDGSIVRRYTSRQD